METVTNRWPARRCTDRWARRSAQAVLRCPRCHTHFDVVHAGACVDANADPEVHLDPIPLLARSGVLSIAVAVEHTDAGMA